MRSLWIHGWASDSRMFEPLLAALPPELAASATALDLPGYGSLSSRPDPDTSYAQYIRGRIERESQRGPLLLAGWSMGAMAALEAAASAVDKVSALVLISGCACFVREANNPGGQDPRLVRTMLHRLQRGREKVVAQFQDTMFAGGEENQREEFSGGLGKIYQVIAAKTLAHGLDYLLHSDLRPGLNKTTCPVLLLHGTRDKVIDFSLAKALASSLGNARLCALEGAGHAPLLTRAGEMSGAIREFIEEGQR